MPGSLPELPRRLRGAGAGPLTNGCRAACLAAWLVLGAAGCETPPAAVGAAREAFATRCAETCRGTGFDDGKVKETEVVGETITRACYCVKGGRETPEPRFTEKGAR